MNRQSIFRVILTSGLLAALIPATGTAQADIVRCVNGEGHATLTDQPCAPGESATVLEVAASAPAEGAQPADPEGTDQQATDEQAAGPEPAPEPEPAPVTRIELPAGQSALPPPQWKLNLAIHHSATRAFALDEATLKAAHAAMLQMDAEARLQKQLALASR